MRRILCIFTAFVFLFTAGCTVPLIGGEISWTPKDEKASNAVADQAAAGDSAADNSAVQPESGVMGAETPSDPSAGTYHEPIKPDASPAEGTGNPADSESESSIAVVKMPVTVYYQDADGYLIPVVRWVERKPGIAKTAVESLITDEESKKALMEYGLQPVLPEGTKLLGINIVDDVAVVDFNTKFRAFENKESERIGVTSIVYTLTEYENVAGVKILINGYSQASLKYGTDISGVMERKDIFINPEGLEELKGTGFRTGENKVDIFFVKKANDEFTYLLPVSIKTDDVVGGEMAPAAMVQFLLKTSPDGGIYSEIPQGTALLDCSMDKGILVVNLDENFINYGGSSREDFIIRQLLYTLKQDRNIDKIKILINGNASVLPEGTDASAGIPIPPYLNDVIAG